MRFFPATQIAALIAALLAPAAQAQDGPVVVEMYTSQGCSSCPPADALLAALAGNADVLALAFHVDYWDYLGWRDDLASPAHTLRQKAYAKAAGEHMVYTPQAIVAGADRMVGSDEGALMTAIMRAMKVKGQTRLSAVKSGRNLEVTAAALASPLRMDVLLVRYVPQVTVDILHGENAGHSILYVNTVTRLTRIGTWTGEAPLRLTAPLAGGEAAAVLLQQSGMGPMIAAARLR